ncbi:MAG: chemotaxis protein CheW [Pseudomonadota bacterium]
MEESRVKCLILPLKKGVLLVPNAVVAEVLNNETLQDSPATAPAWQVGQISWRDQTALPILSFEGVCGEQIPSVEVGANVVVMHSIKPEQKTRYYGLHITDVPTFEFVDAATLTLAPDQDTNPDFVASRVFVNGIEGFIPDLDELARLLD